MWGMGEGKRGRGRGEGDCQHDCHMSPTLWNHHPQEAGCETKRSKNRAVPTTLVRQNRELLSQHLGVPVMTTSVTGTNRGRTARSGEKLATQKGHPRFQRVTSISDRRHLMILAVSGTSRVEPCEQQTGEPDTVCQMNPGVEDSLVDSNRLSLRL